MDPYYSNTVLLLHGDTNFADTSPVNATLTNTGTVTVNTTTKKFGAGSMSFNGNSAANIKYLSTPSNGNYAFGSGDFTVECWVYFNSTTYPQQRVWSNNLNYVANSMYLTLNNGFAFFQVNGGVALQGATQGITTGVWYHIVITKNGNTYRQFVNGVLDGTATNATNPDNGTSSQFYIGRGFANEFLNGLIDDFRITKGFARYIANFSPPNRAFPDVGATVYEYPPATLTSNSTTLATAAYGNGMYILSGSGVANNSPSFDYWLAFNKTNLTDQYLNSATYLSSGGVRAAAPFTTISGVSTQGDYLIMQMPAAITLTSYTLTSQNRTDAPANGYYRRTPYTWKLGGSTNGTTWTLIDARTAVSYTAYNQTPSPFIVSNPVSYAYYIFICQAIQPSAPALNDTYVGIGELKFFSTTTFNMYEYPPAALTSFNTNVSGQPYSNGSYLVSASSDVYGTNASSWLAFDKSTDTAAGKSWYSASSRYATTGVYNATTPISTAISPSGSVSGEWLQIQLPSPITLTSYNITSFGFTSGTFWLRSPSSWTLLGSTNGTTWFVVDSRTSYLFTAYQQTATFACNSSISYNYYRLVVQATHSGNENSVCIIGELRLFSANAVAEYPPVAMTGVNTNISGQPYGNGSYIASASSVNGTLLPFKAFDKSIVDTGSVNIWQAATNSYDASGNYTAGTYSTGIYTGEWLQIQVPAPIVMTGYKITARLTYSLNQAPKIWYVLASNNGSNWSLVDQKSGEVFSSLAQEKSYSFTNSTAYSYYRIVINAIQSGPDAVTISEWQLFGYDSRTISVQYPPVAMTGFNTPVVSGQAYGNGTYVASASDGPRTGNEVWRVFNYNNADGFCTVNGSKYATNSNGVCAHTGTQTTTYNTSLSAKGEFLQIQLPSAIFLTSYMIRGFTSDCRENPNDLTVLGSSDGTTWYLVDTETSIPWTIGVQSGSRTYTIAAGSTPYSYYRMVVHSLNASNGGFFTMAEWRLFGY